MEKELIKLLKANGMWVLATFLSISAIFLTDRGLLPDYRALLSVGAALAALGATTSVILNYLARRSEDEGTSGILLRTRSDRDLQLSASTSLLESVNILREDMQAIKQGMSGMAHGLTDLPDVSKEEITQLIKDIILRDLTDDFVRGMEKKYAINVISSHEQSALWQSIEQIKLRLREEIYSLTRRGNINLAIGGATSLFAIGILSYVVLTAPTPQNIDGITIAMHYIPRLSLVLFIEVFSYFFLRLYRNNLDGIKYFQNEMTTIETRFISLMGGLIVGDKETTRLIVGELAKTERNFVLTKGQTTVEIEKLKLEKSSLQDIGERIIAQVRRKER